MGRKCYVVVVDMKMDGNQVEEKDTEKEIGKEASTEESSDVHNDVDVSGKENARHQSLQR